MASILSPIWMLFRRFSLNRAVICFGHFLLILLFSILTPLILRQVYAAKFVEHEEPLEFTFQTCDSELAGVCSYPEAVIYLDQ
uniref:Uncharacterized protein n=1 Tax=Ditylenchus dipsaci TaxID=166011 RepID=A0A915CN62_9BILA